MYVSYPLKTKKLCACFKAHSKDKQYFVSLFRLWVIFTNKIEK